MPTAYGEDRHVDGPFWSRVMDVVTEGSRGVWGQRGGTPTRMEGMMEGFQSRRRRCCPLSRSSLSRGGREFGQMEKLLLNALLWASFQGTCFSLLMSPLKKRG